MRKIPSAAGLSFVLAVGCARGQDVKAAQACTQLGDAAARLSCYDAAFGAAKTPAGQPSGAVKTDPLAKFGDDGRLHTEVKTDLPKNFTAQVQQVTPLANGLYRLTLDNGQVWTSTEADSALTFKVNDRVTISRMLLGRYEISLAGHATNVSAKRIK
jgi:hypothetical protein